jgi:hypothetical protein
MSHPPLALHVSIFTSAECDPLVNNSLNTTVFHNVVLFFEALVLLLVMSYHGLSWNACTAAGVGPGVVGIEVGVCVAPGGNGVGAGVGVGLGATQTFAKSLLTCPGEALFHHILELECVMQPG